MSSKKRDRVYSCTVPDCQTTQSEGFSRLPTKEPFRQEWIDKLHLNPDISVHRVCRLHFQESDFGKGERTQVLKGTVPSRNLPVRT